MTPATYSPNPLQRRMAWVLVGLLLVVSTLVSQRSFLMLVHANDAATAYQHSGDSDRTPTQPIALPDVRVWSG